MNKQLLIIVLMILNFKVYAQFQGQTRVIHGYEIPSTSGFFGMTFGGEYFPIHNLSVAPSVIFYIPASGNARGFDLNMRYYVTEGTNQVYALIGYGNYIRASESNPVVKTTFNSINMGMGALFKLRDEIGINPEIRYQPGDRREFIFRLAFVYFIN
jgi:hypothetical protein